MSRARRRRIVRKRRGRFLRIISLGVFFAFLTFFLAAAGILASCAKDLPRLESQTAPEAAQTSKMYATDGSLIASLYAEQNRVIVPLSEIPKSIQDAVIAIEDQRFYKHKGVDFEAIARAVIINLKRGKIVEGASTITQQYVKNTFITPEKTLRRKIKEAVLAYQVEKKYSKKIILEKYLNTIYFGHGCYGIETTAETFFGKKARDLNLPECALLAGLIKSPGYYSPYTNPDKAKARRDLVLKRMAVLGFITAEEAATAQAIPIQVQEIKEKPIRAPYFVEYVKQILIDKYGANAVFKGGLRIFTTLDVKMQAHAEEAVWSTLDRPEDPSASIVAIDPKTGYIKVIVGGRDFNTQKFNLAVQGRRQAGSSFKTFVLVTAIEDGVSPNKVYQSTPLTIRLPGKDWRVRNATEGSGGPPMTLREGTIKSVNAVFARLIMEIGPQNVVNIAKKMGITSPLNPYPAIALGGLKIGVSPLEMASAYGTLANHGVHCKPLSILKITDSKGKLLEENKVDEKMAINPTTAYVVTDILQDVIRYGTGRRANIGRPAAGKTGTAQNYRDAWFIGYTPDLVASVWVGYPQGQIEMKNIHGIRVVGGSFPAQIWAKFMYKALEDTPPSRFPAPESEVIRVRVCKDSGLLASIYCPNVVTRTFVKGTEPTKLCNIHTAPTAVTVPNVVGLTAEEAKTILTELGFKVNQVNEVYPGVPKGEVFNQEPKEGTEAEPESMVTISVSAGEPVSQKTTVPNVLGMEEHKAIQAIDRAGLLAIVSYEKTSISSKNGEVIKQNPLGGTIVDRRSNVSIRVARYEDS